MKRLYKYIIILLLSIFIVTLSSCNNTTTNNNPISSASLESSSPIIYSTETQINTSKKYYLKGDSQREYMQWKSKNEILLTRGSNQFVYNIVYIDSNHFAVGINIYYYSDSLIYQLGYESNYYTTVILG